MAARGPPRRRVSTPAGRLPGRPGAVAGPLSSGAVAAGRAVPGAPVAAGWDGGAPAWAALRAHGVGVAASSWPPQRGGPRRAPATRCALTTWRGGDPFCRNPVCDGQEVYCRSRRAAPVEAWCAVGSILPRNSETLAPPCVRPTANTAAARSARAPRRATWLFHLVRRRPRSSSGLSLRMAVAATRAGRRACSPIRAGGAGGGRQGALPRVALLPRAAPAPHDMGGTERQRLVRRAHFVVASGRDRLSGATAPAAGAPLAAPAVVAPGCWPALDVRGTGHGLPATCYVDVGVGNAPGRRHSSRHLPVP